MLKQRKILVIVWFGFSLLIALLLIGMMLAGRFDGTEMDYIGKTWFPWIFGPVLGLMISTFVAQEKTGIKNKDAGASSFFFKWCLSLSVFYLLLILVIILAIPFRGPENPTEWLSNTGSIVRYLQALPFASLGFFFYGDMIKKIMGSDKEDDPVAPEDENA